MALALLACSSVVVAQEQSTTSVKTTGSTNDKYSVLTNTFWNNWFITAEGGANIYIGDYDRYASFGKRLAPTGALGVGKWFTPGIGVRVMFDYVQQKGATANRANSYTHAGDPFINSHGETLYYQKFNFYNVHGDVLFNLTNLLCGYKADRVFNFIPYLGLGWLDKWSAPRERDPGAILGFMGAFRLSSALNLNLDVRGTMVSDNFDGEVNNRRQDGDLAVLIGLTYNFNQRFWNRCSKSKYSDAEYDALLGSLNDLKHRNAELSENLANRKVVTNTEIEKHTVVAPLLTIFEINKSKLSQDERVNIGFFAKKIKESSSDVKYKISGYADKGTGSEKRNEELSKERAQAVYDCLTKEFGISESQLEMESQGGVNNMYYDNPALSRATVTQAE